MPRRISSATISALQVGEGQDQIGIELQDFIDIGGNERGDARLLAPHLWRPHRVAGHADDAAVLADEIQRLDGFLRQTHDALGREHAG